MLDFYESFPLELTMMNGMQIHEVKYKEKSSNYHGGHGHPGAEIFYIDRGVLHLKFSETTQLLLEQGDMCIVPPHQFHHYRAEKDKAPNIFTVHFFTDALDLNDIYLVKLTLTDKEREIMASLIAESYQNDIFTQDILKNLIFVFIFTLLRRVHSGHAGNESTVQKPEINYNLWHIQVEEAKKYITDNIAEPATLDEIADKLHVSSSHLSHIFTKIEKCGVLEYTQAERLILAKDLLRNSPLSVTDISRRTGFSTIHYFSSWFKKKTGFKPTEYIKSLQ